MEKMVLYDGVVYPAGSALVGSENRSLRYGDGLFETMKVYRETILLGNLHFERLRKGLAALHFDIPPHFSPEQEILRLCRLNEHPLARVRLNVFRGDAETQTHFIIETWPLEHLLTPADADGLEIGVFPDGRKAIDAYSGLKSNNYLVYLMGSRWARQNGLTECLILNQHGRIADGGISNLFYVRDGVVYTPPLSEGGIDGVMRRHLLARLPGWGYPVREEAVSPGALLEADELFVTNAITGIRWVRRMVDREYGHTLSAAVRDLLELEFS